jgi:thiosulfate/3-mercaptopyruvate sulfurtransferase
VDLLISTKELARNLKTHKLLLVDTRSFLEYSQGHIPGAINIDLIQFHWIDTSKAGVREFIRQSRIILSNIGIKSGKHVIFYDNESGMSAARGVWLLLFFSHKKVSLLDGGFDKWKRDGHTVETKTNSFITSNFKGKPDLSVLATADEIKKSTKKKGFKLIDARSEEEYNGSHVRAARRGHIPTAINIDWQENTQGEVFKTTEELSKIYSSIPKNSEVVTYCQGGYRAAHSFVALKMLGYKKVKMYLGSWGEWGNKANFPVEHK